MEPLPGIQHSTDGQQRRTRSADGPVVFVVEFKVGESSFDRAAVDQVWDYALDLKNFHD